ncbi:MAG: sigma-70 family RNA polymerase sigma factor [Myxococcales bacterium FL481]|nr:MAG: sigma-70 family RNA polymerase sigma factor [Myxococcales bacterium FL481]
MRTAAANYRTRPAHVRPTDFTDRPLSLQEVYRDYAGTVWREARRLGATDDAAEDIVQEVFLIVKRRLTAYQHGRGSVAAWLRGITRRVVANDRRTRARASRRELASPPPSDLISPEDSLDRQHAVAILHRFLGDLDEDKRTVFELCDVEGRTAPEVATQLGVTANVVYSRLRRARIRFERYLEQLRGHDESAPCRRMGS